MKKRIALAGIVPLLVFLLSNMPSFASGGKLYVATDKESYSSAEPVLFQLFLLNSSNSNQTVYVELLDCKGNMLAKKMLPLNISTASGNINLPEKINSEFYILYCYTIGSSGNVENDCRKKISIQQGEAEIISSSAKKLSISCFMEGGTFISQLDNILLLKCIDEKGSPVSAPGKIINERNRTLGQFVTNDLGLAKLIFNPQVNARYFVIVTDKNGTETKEELPAVAASGVSLSVSAEADSIWYSAFSFTTDPKQLDYKLEIISNDEVIYRSDINFQVSLSVVEQALAARDFPEGFLVLKLKNASNKVYAQRVIYNAPAKTSGNTIRVIDSINKRSMVMELPDYVSGLAYLNIVNQSKGQAIKTSAFENHTGPVIASYTDKGVSFNDILISTQDIPSNENSLKQPANEFLTISGTISGADDKPVKNKNINFIFLHKNLKKDFVIAATDMNGKFEVKGLLFYDTVTVFYQLADKSEEKNNIHMECRVTPSLYFNAGHTRSFEYSCESGIEKKDSLIINPVINKNEITLGRVTVKSAKEKSETEKFADKNVSGQHNQTNSLRSEFDFIKNPQLIDNQPLFEFLKGRMGGLIIDVSSKGNITINTTYGGGIGVYLNDMERDANDLGSVSYLQVRDVALVKYYSMPLKPRFSTTKSKYGYSSNTHGGGDLMIYTKNDFKQSDPKVKGLPKTTIVGYSPEVPASEASVNPGQSQCLFWKPNWIPIKNEVIYIQLPPSDPGNISLIIEGINGSGTLFSFTKKLVLN